VDLAEASAASSIPDADRGWGSWCTERRFRPFGPERHRAGDPRRADAVSAVGGIGEGGCDVASAVEKTPDFDLAWRRPDGSAVVVKVKSITSSNEMGQIGLGLGQVLDYFDSCARLSPISLPCSRWKPS